MALAGSFRGDFEGSVLNRGVSGMNPRRKRKKKKRSLLETVGEMTSGVPQEGKLGVIIGALLIGLVYSWIQVSRQLSEVTTELELLQSGAIARKVETSAIAKLLLSRAKEDMKYISVEIEEALGDTNATLKGDSRNFAYDVILPQISTALRLLSNLTRIAAQGREYQFLERLGAKSKTGVGSPEWTYAREEEIRNIIGHPISTSDSESSFKTGSSQFIQNPSTSSGGDSHFEQLTPPTSQQSDIMRFAVMGLLALILIIRAL